jgi:D-proline reductase (dithiol) PrdB
MADEIKTVDGFKFLPPKLTNWIKGFIPETFKGEIPFAPLSKPLSETKMSAVSTAGISLKTDTPFDMEREKKEPLYGDPTYRSIPKKTTGAEVNVNHLHIKTGYINEDINVMLPVGRMEELAAEGVIGGLAPTAYSFYGYQWNNDFLDQAIAPMTEGMLAEGVEAVLLTPA